MVGINSSTHVYGSGSKSILSGNPSIVGIARYISTSYSSALDAALEQSLHETDKKLKESASRAGTEWSTLSDSVEVWYQKDESLLHFGVRNSADDAATALRLEYGDASSTAPKPFLRSTALKSKDEFAKRVGNLLDAALEKNIK